MWETYTPFTRIQKRRTFSNGNCFKANFQNGQNLVYISQFWVGCKSHCTSTRPENKTAKTSGTLGQIRNGFLPNTLEISKIRLKSPEIMITNVFAKNPINNLAVVPPVCTCFWCVQICRARLNQLYARIYQSILRTVPGRRPVNPNTQNTCALFRTDRV